MKNHARYREHLYEFVRGELNEEARSECEGHLRSCAACRSEVEALKAAFESLPPVSHRASTERSEAYWQHFSSRVEQRIAERVRRVSVGDVVQSAVAALWHPRWKVVGAVSGAMAVLLVALGLWLTSGGPRIGEETNGAPVKAVSASSKQAVEEYLSSSRMLLIGISNMDPGTGDPIDLGIEKQAARSLIHQARFLSNEGLDERSQELIDELERILIELANLEENADIPEVEMIRTGVHQQNLLFKIRMAENRLGQ
jgi:hypothetical protein